MVDYEFYVNHYLGSAIPEKAFSGLAAQAKGVLDNLKAVCRVASSGQEAECMALCAMAEVLWAERNKRIASASMGSVALRYNQDKTPLRRQLYEKAGIYLDIYRGVSQ